MQTKYESGTFYILGLTHSEEINLSDHLSQLGYRAGGGYCKNAPNSEWLVWVKISRSKIQELKSIVSRYFHTSIF